jgi:hypothetical protein
MSTVVFVKYFNMLIVQTFFTGTRVVAGIHATPHYAVACRKGYRCGAGNRYDQGESVAKSRFAPQNVGQQHIGRPASPDSPWQTWEALFLFLSICAIRLHKMTKLPVLRSLASTFGSREPCIFGVDL